MTSVRDRLWLWGHEAGSHDPGTVEEWNLPGSSRITPVEAAFHLNLPNLLMVRYGGQPTMPYDQMTIPMRRLQRVIWSITGAMGEKSTEEREHVLDLAARTPNITGLIMDDFINWDTGQPELSIDELRDIQSRLRLSDRTLDLMMVLYSHQLDAPIAEHLSICNQASFWVWDSANLERLEELFSEFERVTPDQQRFLGCYVWDMEPRAPMPLDRFQRQCRMGLEWLRAGRIDGLIFVSSCEIDLGLETVEWLRGWIAGIGDLNVHEQGVEPMTDHSLIASVLADQRITMTPERIKAITPMVASQQRGAQLLRDNVQTSDEPAIIFVPVRPRSSGASDA